MPDRCDALTDYVLGALEAPDRRAFEAHLKDCPACTREAEALVPVRDALAVSVPPRTPPPALRASVLAEVHREAALLQAATTPTPAPARARPRRAWRFAWPGLAAAGAAASLALGVVVAREEPSARTVAVAGTGAARGTLELREGGARLQVRGLPSPGADRVYQVWIRRGEAAPRPTDALFAPSRAGTGTVAVPAALAPGDRVLVTAEPAGGSAAPTSAPVLSATV